MIRSYIALVPYLAVLLPGACATGRPVVCPNALYATDIVAVRDSGTNHPAGPGVTGYADDMLGGTALELQPIHGGLFLRGLLGGRGRTSLMVSVRKPGYISGHTTVQVEQGRCSRYIAEVTAISLTRDPRAIPVTPVRFDRGEHVVGHPAGAGIRVLGDTLVIAGRAAAPCSQLDITAFRTGAMWHIQLQPQQWVRECDTAVYLQQFESRFLLVEGTNQILVTQAIWLPSELFSGTVAPTMSRSPFRSALHDSVRFVLGEIRGYPD